MADEKESEVGNMWAPCRVIYKQPFRFCAESGEEVMQGEALASSASECKEHAACFSFPLVVSGTSYAEKSRSLCEKSQSRCVSLAYPGAVRLAGSRVLSICELSDDCVS